jgi:hypothetical protein
MWSRVRAGVKRRLGEHLVVERCDVVPVIGRSGDVVTARRASRRSVDARSYG